MEKTKMTDLVRNNRIHSRKKRALSDYQRDRGFSVSDVRKGEYEWRITKMARANQRCKKKVLTSGEYGQIKKKSFFKKEILRIIKENENRK